VSLNPNLKDKMTINSAALLNRIAEGDVDACSTFYDATSGLTFSLMMHILQNRDAAEEALHDLYVQVWTRDRLPAHHTDNPLTWLIELARNTAVARLPRNQRAASRRQLPVPSPTRPSSVVPFEPCHRERQHASRGLAQLTDEQRTILQMTYFGGLSAREAAQELGLPVHHVTREIHTAMQALRDAAANS
jgi:RNA polymerase sigma-70 factor (ECF subfamily)